MLSLTVHALCKLELLVDRCTRRIPALDLWLCARIDWVLGPLLERHLGPYDWD